MFNWLVASKKDKEEVDVEYVPVIPKSPALNLDLAHKIRDTKYNYLYYVHPQDLNNEINEGFTTREERMTIKKLLITRIEEELFNVCETRRARSFYRSYFRNIILPEFMDHLSLRNIFRPDRNLHRIFMRQIIQEIREKTEERKFLEWEKRKVLNDLCEEVRRYFRLKDNTPIMKEQYWRCSSEDDDSSNEEYFVVNKKQKIPQWYDFGNQAQTYTDSYTQSYADYSSNGEMVNEETQIYNASRQSPIFKFEIENNLETFNWDQKMVEWGIRPTNTFNTGDIEMGFGSPAVKKSIEIHNGHFYPVNEEDIMRISKEIGEWGEALDQEVVLGPLILEEEVILDPTECYEEKVMEEVIVDYPSLNQTPGQANTQNYLNERKKHNREGFLELYIGPMFSGKSSKVLFKLSSMADQRFRCLYVNSAKDVRKTEAQDAVVTTHNSSYSRLSSKIDCVKVTNLKEVSVQNYDYIAIDEFQFFDTEDAAMCVVDWVSLYGKYILIASLDADCYRRKFGRVLDLIPHADEITKLAAYCDMCRDNYGILKKAPFTARMTSDTTAELVGGSDLYKAMCRNCHDFHLDVTVSYF